VERTKRLLLPDLFGSLCILENVHLDLLNLVPSKLTNAVQI
jgi:hypothetical protein